ncbi:shikimate dehydrogenase [Chitinasiproducens palmae]|uniref:Shikimate dehydrogenase (NADP(+)) n=1 Tax=Chitinasiproducens palmae TaxID=1770053 RepID=A0A1H2PRI5_9BURK|nr:shikimate dehydrogenase [Chitinasiproducens palmae]
MSMDRRPDVAPVDRYAVIGNPIGHSRSPEIHRAFSTATGEPLDYQRLLAPLDGFEDAARRFFAEGGLGLNVTVPFKLAAFTLADRLAPRAAAAGAVNTLRREDDGTLYGDNTDGAGLVRDLTVNLATALAGRDLLLIGAGGAARGVVLPLLECGPASLTVVNRSAARANALCEHFAASGVADSGLLHSGDVGLATARPYDVVINATSSSLTDAVPCAFTIAADGLAYDMMYGARPSAFMQAAAAQSARVADGLGMLVEQAAESFRLWRGVLPSGQPVLAALRDTLTSEGDAGPRAARATEAASANRPATPGAANDD